MSIVPHGSLLKFLSREEEAILLEQSQKIAVTRRKPLLLEGEENTGVYIVTQGLVKVFRNQNGNLFFLGLATKGDLLGLDSALFNTVNKTTCVAAQDSIALFISRETLNNIMQTDKTIFIKLMGYLSERINQLESRIFDVTHKKVIAHFAELIYRLSSTSYKTVIIPNIVSITEMADLVGTTKFYIYKLIQKLEDKNAVTFSGRKLKITNKEILRLMCNKDSPPVKRIHAAAKRQVG